MASHLAGLGQASGTGVGAVHAIGHAIGTRGRLPTGRPSRPSCPRCSGRTSAFASASWPWSRWRSVAGVPARSARPRPPEPRSTGSTTSCDRVGQRRTLRELGLGPDLEPVIVADAVDDAAIANSPRIPSADEIAAILATVSGA